MKRARRGGFTMIELVTVMVVLVILAAIAIPRLFVSRDKAYRNTIVADLRNVASLQEIYLADQMTYTDDLALLGMNPSQGVVIEITEATGQGWAATATHGSLPTGQCGVFYGSASQANGDPATTAGVIACDFGEP